MLDWFTANDLHYGVYDNVVNFTTARCLCDSQPGVTRLAVLDRESDFEAVQSYLWMDCLGEVLWVDANRTLHGQFQLLTGDTGIVRECHSVIS